MTSSPSLKSSIYTLIIFIIFLIFTSIVLYLLLQKSVKAFKHDEMAKHMEWMGNSVIYFCNASYDSLARVGEIDNISLVRLNQADAIEKIDDFARNNGFKILVIETSEVKSYLLLSSFPDNAFQVTVFEKQPLYQVKPIFINEIQYNTFTIHFDSWNWRIVLFKDSSSYDTLLSRLNIFYISFGVLFILLCIVMFLFFSQLARTGRILRKNELELKSILDSLVEGVITLDDKGLITQINPASFSICQLLPDQAPIGAHLCDVLNFTYGKKRNPLKKSDVEAGGSESLFAYKTDLFYLTLPDGTEHTIQMRFSRRIASQNVGNLDSSLVISFQDVTDKMRMQEAMLQSEKMLSVGGLAAGMAHEINNPLAGIMQNAQVIKNRFTAVLPANEQAARESHTTIESIQTYMEKRKILLLLDNILEAGGNAAKIVSNMLSFARKGDLEKKKYDIAELLEKTIDLAQSDFDLKKKYDFKQVTIIKNFQPDIPKVRCEDSKLMQVFFNLIKNATEAMHESDSTKHPELFFRLHTVENKVQIEIEDNGPGMDEKTRKSIFEPFFTTKEVDKGTGLGLSLSYFIIVDNHGGEMAVESSPGAGTKFIIRIPIN